MISIGQLIGRAFGALWRKRMPVLGIVLAWLVLDGLLLGYLKTYHPDFGLAHTRLFRGVFRDVSATSDWLRFFISFLPELARDATRAVFAVLLLRSLLAPLPGGAEKLPAGVLKPMLLLFLFECAWTAVMYPLEYGMLQLVSNRTIDPETGPWLIAWARILIFVAYSLALSRLCFIYANATLGLGLRPGTSWRETKGPAVRLLLLFLLIPLPLGAASSFLSVHSSLLDLARESIQHYLLANFFIDSLDFVLTGVPVFAVIAVAYVVATGYPAAAIPGTKRTSVELARAFD